MPKAKPKAKRRRVNVEVVPTTPEAIFERVADTVSIPPETRLWFRSELEEEINAAIWEVENQNNWEALRKRKAHHRQSLRRIAKAANALAEAIEHATYGADACLRRAFFEQRLRERGAVGGKIDQEYDKLIWSVFEASTVASDALHLADFKVYRRRLATFAGNAMTPRHFAGQQFVSYFILKTLKAGGQLTLDKTTGCGTLIDALNYCKPLLPDGLKIPSPSSLQTMKSKIEKALPTAPWWKLSPAERIG
jgi:hypothetical protein